LITIGLASVGTTLSVTGNANVGNLGTAGLVTATGNVGGGNINTGGLVTATGNVGGGNINTGGLVTATGNITGGNLITGGLITATGNITSTANITGGNLITGGTLSATGNANVGNLGTAGLITATGNIGGGNINTGGLVTATGNINSGANIVATANVIGGNMSTAGLVTATGNITGGNLITGGILSATGNANVGNLGTAGLITATGNIGGGNINTGGLVTATGNITGGNIITSGLITATGNITATANIAGGNISTGGLITATGNITGGNITTAGIASLGNLRISENTINGASGYVFINAIQQDVDFAVNGDTASNIFYVDGGTGTASFGSATQTTNAIVAFNSNKSVLMPVGTTGERPGSGVTGMMRFNTSVNNLEFYDANSWQTAGSQFTVIVANTQVGNGVEVAFTLPADSTTAGTIVAINGVVQIPTTAYSVSANVCTFTEAPESTDYIDFRVLTTTSSVSALSSSTGALVEASASAIELDFTGNVVPTANLTYSLGSSTNFWKSLYVGGNSIYLGSLILKDAGSNTFAVYTSDGTTQANLDVGTIDVSAINSGTSTIGISGTNGNAYISVGGVANIFVASTTGSNVTGTLGVSGNATVGNISATTHTGTTVSVTGNVTGGNLTTGGLISATGNVTGGNLTTGGLISATGNVTGGNLITGGLITATGNITATANIAGGNISTGGLITATGNITGSFILGNGSQLTGIDATSIQSGTSNVKVVSSGGNVTTSVGGTSNVLVVTGTGANIAGTLSASGNITAGNVTGTGLTGLLLTASQTNITSVGTLGSLAVAGNISPGGIAMSTGNATIGNLYVSGTTTIAGNITQVSGNSGQFFGNASTGFNALYAGLPAGFTLLPQSVVNFVSQFDSYSQINNQNQSAGNTATADYVLTSNNGNDSTYYLDMGIASSTYDGAVAILDNAMGTSVTPNDAYLYVTGNVAAGNPSDLVLGAVDAGGQIRFAVAGSNAANVAMKLNAPNTTSSSTTTGTAVITGGVGVSGNITSGNLSVGTGTVTLGNIVNANGNGIGNIGSSSLYFNTVFAKATSAQYADLAEMYVADADYTPGTVMSFGGEHEVTISGVNSDKRIAGVISTNPSYVMNATQAGDHVVAVALTGRVPTRVTGAVAKGDMMVSNGDGTARAESNPQVGSVIGKALEDFIGAQGTIEVVVGRF
jgi:filamentous hemagglutinin